MIPITVEPAAPADLKIVLEILSEAADWLRQRNMTMWRDNELAPEILAGYASRRIGVRPSPCRSPSIRGRGRFNSIIAMGGSSRPQPEPAIFAIGL